MNLLANAVKFTASGGVHIHLGLEAHAVSAPGIGADRVHLRIAVCDSGVGIDPATVEVLFRPFEQETRAFHGAFAARVWACPSPTNWPG